MHVEQGVAAGDTEALSFFVRQRKCGVPHVRERYVSCPAALKRAASSPGDPDSWISVENTNNDANRPSFKVFTS
jgi:hypothetical protein